MFASLEEMARIYMPLVIEKLHLACPANDVGKQIGRVADREYINISVINLTDYKLYFNCYQLVTYKQKNVVSTKVEKLFADLHAS